MLSITENIAQNIRRFDICSLLKLLKELGYQTEDLYFESHDDLSVRSSLCEAIYFSQSWPKVRIVLNLGLLSANSPLPNFFRRKMDSGSIDAALFTKYLGFFNHHAIKNLLLMSTPDINDIFFTNWQQTKSHYLKLLDLNSSSTLWHLFQICFPELVVQVIKAPRVFKQNSSSTMLGKTRLGVNSFLGKKITQKIPSFKILLTTDEPMANTHRSWPIEIKQRLKKMVFAFLQRTEIHFRVVFILKNNREMAHLAKSTQLGYCMLGEGKEDLKMLLFSGYSKESVVNLQN